MFARICAMDNTSDYRSEDSRFDSRLAQKNLGGRGGANSQGYKLLTVRPGDKPKVR